MPSTQAFNTIVKGVGFHNQISQFSLIITVVQIFWTSVNTVKAAHLSQAVSKAAELRKAKKKKVSKRYKKRSYNFIFWIRQEQNITKFKLLNVYQYYKS